MDRSTFLKNIIGLFGLASLPPTLLKQYQKLYLLQFFIRGFQYNEGQGLLDQMNEGSVLKMVRDPGNEYDPCAIALFFNGRKIGFVPAESNEILSRLMDAGVIELHAEITHVEKETASWENVHAAVSILKELDSALPESAMYMTELGSPEYYTLYNKNYVSRIRMEETPILSGGEFYEALVDNSETDEVYDLIHESFSYPGEMEEVVNKSLLVVNRNRLPNDLTLDTVVKAIDQSMIELDNTFDENGYVVACVNRVAELSPRIESFMKIADKTGRTFYEVVFKLS